MEFVQLIDIKIPTIVGISTFMNRINKSTLEMKILLILAKFYTWLSFKHGKGCIVLEPDHTCIKTNAF